MKKKSFLLFDIFAKFSFFPLRLNYLHTFYLGKFGYCLMKHIVTILSRRSADLENISWIQSEAAMFASVNRTGTLRYIHIMCNVCF